MNHSAYEMYRDLLEADPRYLPAYERVTLRTLCGCERVDKAASDVVRAYIRISDYKPTDRFDVAQNVTSTIREFVNTGRRDDHGRLIFLEKSDSMKDLLRLREVEQKYKQLWESVYGVDQGL